MAFLVNLILVGGREEGKNEREREREGERKEWWRIEEDSRRLGSSAYEDVLGL